MPQVFISHSSRDASFIEDELIPVLRRHGIQTWYSSEDIPSAALWETKIRDGLTSSDWFLVVVSPHSVASEWVRTEVHWAIEKRSERLVSVLIGDADPTDLHLRLIRYQHIDYRVQGQRARQSLVAVFGAALKPESGMEIRIRVEDSNLESEARSLVISESATIGRASTTEIRVDSPRVSRSHAVLRVREREQRKALWLCDLGGTNGTFLNGVRMTEPTLIRDGDVIAVGDVKLVVESVRDLAEGNPGPDHEGHR